MDKLLPCPFCGGEVELLDFTDKVYGFWDYKIKCKKCRAYMDSPSTAVVSFTDNGLHQTRNEETMQKAKRELIIIWNTRTKIANDRHQEDLIPKEVVLEDIKLDDGIVSSGARDYYRTHYATEEEKRAMDRQDKLANIGAMLFYLILIAFVVTAVILEV